ncbi:MAG: C4-type zinc ribbon domain-containing protein [Chloroflexota bacterium]|nr:C4-type zinc ribbon domain-containing protein [Chloroflexota bacterium]
MSTGRQLYELQEVDLEIKSKRDALAAVESRLGPSRSLQETRSSLQAEEQRLEELKTRQHEGEWEADDLRSKVKVVEDKLYGGSVKNPKELTGMQEQATHLRRRSEEEEDKVLDLMAQVEGTQATILRLTAEAENLESAWRLEQQELTAQQEALSATLTELDERRRGLASKIDQPSLRLYEELRAKKQGRAVAKVEQGMCQGCRIVLPARDLQRARGGQELVQCSSCERILYIS